jgi:replication factor C small subunit
MTFRISFSPDRLELGKRLWLSLLLIIWTAIIFTSTLVMNVVSILSEIKYRVLQALHRFKGIKVVILDEADFITIQGQAALRNVIETYSRTTRFILTCNFVERIIDPLQSRCQVLKIVPPSKSDIAKHVAGIIEKENVEYELDDIKLLVNQFYPDLRKMLNTAQLSTQEGKLVIDKSIIVSSNYTSQVLKELTKSKPSFNEIRQIIANANVQDFEELYRFLYDNASAYAAGSEGMVAIHINEYSYQANFRIDKEINCMALMSRLIELAKPRVL